MDPVPAKNFDQGLEYDLIVLCVKLAENFYKSLISEPAWMSTAASLFPSKAPSFRYRCFVYLCFLWVSYLYEH